MAAPILDTGGIVQASKPPKVDSRRSRSTDTVAYGRRSV
ncbi:hypothetical protein E5Q_01600 [Mixia osmundae IAM 14324]|uniref:Uncharacterized protein n=1 Tax=Mixia osmundae (strain CBS 9802 / IAM 14324 / JCM 22182 / KY 12970) TaxID=764103 RepID=G7DWI5_MIXOS|nr:hypothetical protein E5Q_01600 [Mixia osmundae IAM 14324]